MVPATIAFFDDGLLARFVVLLLDNGGPFSRLTFLDHGGAITVNVTVRLTDGHTRTNGPHSNADIVGECGGSKRRNGCNNKSVFHIVLHWVSMVEQFRLLPNVPDSWTECRGNKRL